MKISHGQLEIFRASPVAFASQQYSRAFTGPSMFRMWQYALKKIHSEDVEAAAAYLDETITSNFKVNDRNERKLEKLIEELYRYSADFKSLKHVAIEVLKPMALNVSPKLTIAGEITRLDLVPGGGYAVFVLSRDERDDWREQIRFPIIQGHYAKKMNCALSEVAVGIYSIPDGKHELKRFPAAIISAAQSEIVRLAKRIP